MSTGLIVALSITGYVIVGALVWWRAYVPSLDFEIREVIKLRPGISIEGARKRAEAEVTGIGAFFAGLFWPVSLAVLMVLVPVFTLIDRTNMFVTPIEREYAQREELKALRQLAKDNGLDFPEMKL